MVNHRMESSLCPSSAVPRFPHLANGVGNNSADRIVLLRGTNELIQVRSFAVCPAGCRAQSVFSCLFLTCQRAHSGPWFIVFQLGCVCSCPLPVVQEISGKTRLVLWFRYKGERRERPRPGMDDTRTFVPCVITIVIL